MCHVPVKVSIRQNLTFGLKISFCSVHCVEYCTVYIYIYIYINCNLVIISNPSDLFRLTLTELMHTAIRCTVQYIPSTHEMSILKHFFTETFSRDDVLKICYHSFLVKAT